MKRRKKGNENEEKTLKEKREKKLVQFKRIKKINLQRGKEN